METKVVMDYPNGKWMYQLIEMEKGKVETYLATHPNSFVIRDEDQEYAKSKIREEHNE